MWEGAAHIGAVSPSEPTTKEDSMYPNEETRLDLLRKLLKPNTRVSTSKLVITNFAAWWEAASRLKGWTLYRIETLTPGRYYIGISSQPLERIHAHLRGQTWFTSRYGVGSVTFLAVWGTKADAERAEWGYWVKCAARDGAEQVGGFDATQLYPGLA